MHEAPIEGTVWPGAVVMPQVETAASMANFATARRDSPILGRNGADSVTARTDRDGGTHDGGNAA